MRLAEAEREKPTRVGFWRSFARLAANQFVISRLAGRPEACRWLGLLVINLSSGLLIARA